MAYRAFDFICTLLIICAACKERVVLWRCSRWDRLIALQQHNQNCTNDENKNTTKAISARSSAY